MTMPQKTSSIKKLARLAGPVRRDDRLRHGLFFFPGTVTVTVPFNSNH
jgi:hypothetical protein